MSDSERWTCEDVMAELTARMADATEHPGAPTERTELSRPLAEHLEACADCRREAAELEEVWSGLGELPEVEAPTEVLRERVGAVISAYRAGLEAAGEEASPWAEEPRPRWPPRRRDRTPGFHPALRWAAASRWAVASRWAAALAATVAAAAIGLAVGWVAFSGREGGDVAALRTEVRSLHQMVALSLLEGASASERLRGVSFGASLPEPGTPVTAALVQTVGHDPNVNVRLAAVDALRPVASNAHVRRALIDALAAEQSPLVQVAIADLLLDTDGEEARDAVSSLLDDPTLHPAVRGHLRERLGQRI